MILLNPIKMMDIRMDRYQFSELSCCIFESPKTTPREAPKSKKVTEKVIIFLLVFSQSDRPMFSQITSSGSGASSTLMLRAFPFRLSSKVLSAVLHMMKFLILDE